MAKITRTQFEDVLRKISSISYKERKYIMEVFRSATSDGLSKQELKNKIYSLKKISDDPVNSIELDMIKRETLEKIEELEG